MRNGSNRLDASIISALNQAFSSPMVTNSATNLFARAISSAVSGKSTAETPDATKGDSIFDSMIRIQKRQSKELERMQRAFSRSMSTTWRATTKAVLSAWQSMWQGLIQGWNGDKFLSLIFDTLARIAAAFGQLMVLSGIAMQTVPIFGFVSGTKAVAAGLALLAFAGILKGAASIVGSSNGSGASASGSGGGYGAGSAVAISSNGSGKQGSTQVVYNITIESSGTLDTAESIAQRLEEVMRRGRAMGYAL